MEAVGEILTLDEFAERYKVPKTWIYNRTRRGNPDPIPHLKVGRYVRFRVSDVEKWFISRAQEKSERWRIRPRAES